MQGGGDGFEAIKAGITSRKRFAASMGEDPEEIDAENARDQARAKALGLQYTAYPALESLDFSAILRASLVEDAEFDAAQDVHHKQPHPSIRNNV